MSSNVRFMRSVSPFMEWSVTCHVCELAEFLDGTALKICYMITMESLRKPIVNNESIEESIGCGVGSLIMRAVVMW